MPVRWRRRMAGDHGGRRTVPYAHRRPTLPAQSASVPMSGNFSVRDEFDNSSLARYWSFVRIPRQQWHDLSSASGALTIRARSDHIGRVAQPSFVGRRQQHAWASASTAMRYAPARPGEEAGLVAMQSEDYYYFLGVAFENGHCIVRLKRRAGPSESADGNVVASAKIDAESSGPIYLRIDARGDRYDFFYGLRRGEWIPLVRDADGTILSTRVAGGFVGVMIGMYAYAP